MNSFVFIVPGYNNNKWIKKCFNSIENTLYHKKRVIYINDASTEEINFPKTTFNLQIIKNKKRLGPAYSRWIAIQETKPEEIIIFLDGDDWLSYAGILDYLDICYQDKTINWTVSNYRKFKNGQIELIPTYTNLPLIPENPCRTHLRTGYSWIWKDMPESWIKINNEYLTCMTDFNENLWAIKKIGQPHKLNSILLIYNCDSSKTTTELSSDKKEKIKEKFLKSKFN